MSTQLYPVDSGFPPTITPFVGGTPPAHRFSVDEYHHMIETGILTENDRVELLDGWILEMSPIGPPHEVCVSLLMESMQKVLPTGWMIRVQSPITLPNSEPQPDASIVRGRPRDFLTHHPLPAEVGIVIEISESSLSYDRRQKRRSMPPRESPSIGSSTSSTAAWKSSAIQLLAATIKSRNPSPQMGPSISRSTANQWLHSPSPTYCPDAGLATGPLSTGP